MIIYRYFKEIFKYWILNISLSFPLFGKKNLYSVSPSWFYIKMNTFKFSSSDNLCNFIKSVSGLVNEKTLRNYISCEKAGSLDCLFSAILATAAVAQSVKPN